MLNNELPLFSVLIANYNNGKYLMEAIKSVEQQTYDNWEIIIIDDASTDASNAIYKELKANSKLTIAYNSSNKGCGFTKRRCIDLANGELCGFLDPDDALYPQALEEMVKEHIRLPEYSLVYSTHTICNEYLKPTDLSTSVGYNSTPIPDNESHLTCEKGNISAFASFKKEKYMRTSGINANLKRAVDQDLYYKIEEQGRVLYINKPLYYYRHHANSISLNENLLKSQYWKLVAATDAYKRRIAISHVPNLSKRTLDKSWLAYFLKKAIYHSKKKNWSKMYLFLFKASRYTIYDTKFSILRIGISPIKTKSIF